MARTDNLTNFLNDVATAIKSKLDDSTAIPASQFDTKIMSIETVGTYQSKTIPVTTNGSQTITPDQGYDALSSIVINTQVPIPQLQTKSYEFTDNATITLSPETGYDGFSSISLTIAVPGSINNQNKTITPTTSQQVISADQGYTGLGDVTVNAVTSSIDQNIVAGNIKDGVSILGVTGNYIGPGDTEYAINLALSNQILGGSLPYIELQYIQGTGTQWIDTNYVPHQGDEFEFRNVTIPSQTGGTIFWCDRSTYKVALAVYDNGSRQSGYFGYCSYDTTGFYDGVFIDNGTINITSDGKLYYNNELRVTSTATKGDPTGNFILWLRNTQSSSDRGSAKIGRIIITNNNIIQRQFIPVQRRSDNEICMYEMITGTFFTNQGTGSFIAGPVIN